MTLLEQAYSLWNKVEQAPAMLETMVKAETQHGVDSPFSSVGQMYQATLQCKKAPPAKLAWVREAILDATKLLKEDVSKHRLTSSEGSVGSCLLLSVRLAA